MSTVQPRLRMFAGPNGSGKSTLKAELEPDWLGVYINADEIEQALREQANQLDLAGYGITSSSSELADFFQRSTLLQKAGLTDVAARFALTGTILTFDALETNSYLEDRWSRAKDYRALLALPEASHGCHPLLEPSVYFRQLGRIPPLPR